MGEEETRCPFCGEPTNPLLVVKDEENREPEVVAIPSCFPCSYAALEEVKG